MKAAPPPRISEGVLRVFAAYSRRYVRQRFHAVRILRSGLPQPDEARPLVIYLNHAAWWDPLVCLLLSRDFFASRNSFAAIDAAMLERYGIFKRLGFFPVESQSARGARQFLRTTEKLLASPRNAVWLTPQGRFTDVRERPLRLARGLGAVALQTPGAAFVPLAIEYTFWTEPRPEVLVSFGPPIVPAIAEQRDAGKWTSTFTTALAAAQDMLADHSCRRDPAEWLTLDRGRTGVSGVYDAWRWLRAQIRGETFSPEHRAAPSR